MISGRIDDLKEAFVQNVSVPSRQAQIIAGLALVVSVIALIMVATKASK